MKAVVKKSNVTLFDFVEYSPKMERGFESITSLNSVGDISEVRHLYSVLSFISDS